MLKGAATTLVGVEPYIVELCKQKAHMGQPMDMTEGLAMADSIIDSSQRGDD